MSDFVPVDGCSTCGPWSVPGYVPSTIPVGHPDNPYPYPYEAYEAWKHCPACNGVREAVRRAGMDSLPHDADGWPQSWPRTKEAIAPHPSMRGMRDGDPGPLQPLPPEFARIKWATRELNRLMGMSPTATVMRRRAALGRILDRLARRIEARARASAARPSRQPEMTSGRRHLRPLP
jgi:hypothetical protein